ncbi:uncharacterized protein [Parasteatoda tepidariorum]|uniref:uncharacterized protein n=1 Tax=Parasteatoda tepidariorum TaxID=114398 RepID=UPI00077F9F89|nr:uncharacterized protein LOC107436880 [Parasteatoda tepidariorum]
MLRMIGILLVSSLFHTIYAQEQAEHRNFQYQSAIDPLTGRYNFAYDTGNDNNIAHSMHMQYQDADGMVRGRYGYTDPRGKLRMVEYEAGPDGFIARGDVGVDMALHDNTPVVSSESPISSYREGDFLLDPAPVQMAGWDPEGNPMGTNVAGNPQNVETATSAPESENADVSYINPFDRSLFPGFPSLNVTSNNPITVNDPSSAGYDERYPRILYSAVESPDEPQTESEAYRSVDNQPMNYNQNSNLNINNIDVNPEEIRKAAGSDTVQNTAEASSNTVSERVQRQVSTPVKVTTSDGRRLFYRDSHSMEPHEHYYYGPNHDHDSETRYYYRPRQTHDHDSERRYYRTYYRPRQTHDHDNERRYYRTYYRPRQTHDHDAERRYRQTHDHDAERYNYYRKVYRNGRTLYIDRHSKVPHAHTSDAYQNDQDHQHSDVHLYARYRNSEYPATAKPRQLQYIPSDRYHDKDYYWTYS